MLRHKPLHNHSACKVICDQTGSNLGMQNVMRKVVCIVNLH